jgi:hypothetical protein
MDIGNEQGYGEDIGIMWAAYKAGSFPEYPEGMEQEQFVEVLLNTLAQFDSLWMADDDNNSFGSGRGPIALFGLRTDGEIVKVHAKFFKWRRNRNILRTFVSFFHWMRYSRHVGVVVWRSEEEYFPLYFRMREYGLPVFNVGNGFFAMPGRKK